MQDRHWRKNMIVRRGRIALVLLLTLAVLAGCGAATPAAPTASPMTAEETPVPLSTATTVPTPTAQAVDIDPTATDAASPAAETAAPVPTKPSSGNLSGPGSGITGEVPDDLMDKIMSDLEQRTGQPRSEFVEVVGAAVEWSDASLGCPQPGRMYPQVITPGYHIVLRVDDVEYDYRATTEGFFFLCSPNDA